MKLSQTGLGTIKVNNLDEIVSSTRVHYYKQDQLVQYGAGIYAYNTCAFIRLRQKRRKQL